MKIVRDGKEYELTYEELYLANCEFITNFMRNEMIENHGISEENADKLSKEAFDLYSNGDGESEYECIEKVVNKFNRNKE